jgi:hypothetical protein
LYGILALFYFANFQGKSFSTATVNITQQIFAVFRKGVPVAGFGPGPTGSGETTRAREPR